MAKTYKQSICFSGSGHHYPWRVGVALDLQENDDLSECCFTGASAGSRGIYTSYRRISKGVYNQVGEGCL